jgi:hypothetical protein
MQQVRQAVKQYPSTYLVGGLEHVLFFHILGIIIPTDFFFRGVGIPPTSYQFHRIRSNWAGHSGFTDLSVHHSLEQ